MRPLTAALIFCAALSIMAGSANAGECTVQITQMRQAAQRNHQPMPDSVTHAQTYAQLMLAAELAEAEALDAIGSEADCLLAARRAKETFAPG
jgi:hypothetical protein